VSVEDGECLLLMVKRYSTEEKKGKKEDLQVDL
jgi:hypothetical protein